MSDPKMVTERDAVLREREAFQMGAGAVFGHFAITFGSSYGSAGWRGSSILAEERYPLPKVTRARVVEDPHDYRLSYRLLDGEFQYLRAGGAWREMGEIGEDWSDNDYPTPARVRVWADLLANPTEECEA